MAARLALTLGRWATQSFASMGLWLMLSCASLCLPLQAQSVLPVPALTASVLDTTDTLAEAQTQALQDKLSSFERSTGAQMVILLVTSTLPEDIASYANRVANTWKIGRKGVGDGLLLIVAKNDRKVRIEVAKSLEGAIPDLAAKTVIDEAITPHFKQGDFAGGLDAALDQLMARIKGEALPAPVARAERPADGFQWTDLAVFLFIAVPMLGGMARRMMGRNLGSIATGGGISLLALLLTRSWLLAGLAGLVALAWTLLSGFGRVLGGSGWGASNSHGWSTGGGGGFSSGGGGFSSGGGGDFGGGGTSGDW
jgi:uncharacterized protein